MKSYEMYINGEWTQGSERQHFETLNPYSQTPWATIPQASHDDVRAAIAAARNAFDSGWRRMPGLKRAALMIRLADIIEREAKPLAIIESTDNGKVIRETNAQMIYTARVFRYFAGLADKQRGSTIPLDHPDIFDFTVREPYGVVGLITAWNSPIALLANKLPAALAAGNCAIIKPSEHASASTLEFCRFVEEAGFPPGVINVVTGDAKVGTAMTELEGIDKISFTGSPGVGRRVAAAAAQRLIPVTLELGGKSPNIIFEDADLPRAIVGALAGIFAATGQTCIAGSRLLVQRSVYDTVVERLVERANKIVMGNPLEAATEMGTAANRPQFERILAAIEEAKAQGAKVAAGGGGATDPALKGGLFIKPTIFRDVHPEMTVAQSEIFGPVLSVIPFDSEEEAISIANGTKLGLASGVWTQDISRALRMIRAMDAGVVWVNTYRMVSAQAPFGGRKESGYGKERGDEGLLEFSVLKNVMVDFSGEDRDPFAAKT